MKKISRLHRGRRPRSLHSLLQRAVWHGTGEWRLGYERWIFDNPKINSAISLDRGTTRISHLGLQAEDDELAIIKGRIVADGVTYDAA